jgi:hypothetical protein
MRVGAGRGRTGGAGGRHKPGRHDIYGHDNCRIRWLGRGQGNRVRWYPGHQPARRSQRHRAREAPAELAARQAVRQATAQEARQPPAIPAWGRAPGPACRRGRGCLSGQVEAGPAAAAPPAECCTRCTRSRAPAVPPEPGSSAPRTIEEGATRPPFLPLSSISGPIASRAFGARNHRVAAGHPPGGCVDWPDSHRHVNRRHRSRRPCPTWPAFGVSGGGRLPAPT